MNLWTVLIVKSTASSHVSDLYFPSATKIREPLFYFEAILIRCKYFPRMNIPLLGTPTNKWDSWILELRLTSWNLMLYSFLVKPIMRLLVCYTLDHFTNMCQQDTFSICATSLIFWHFSADILTSLFYSLLCSRTCILISPSRNTSTSLFHNLLKSFVQNIPDPSDHYLMSGVANFRSAENTHTTT